MCSFINVPPRMADRVHCGCSEVWGGKGGGGEDKERALYLITVSHTHTHMLTVGCCRVIYARQGGGEGMMRWGSRFLKLLLSQRWILCLFSQLVRFSNILINIHVFTVPFSQLTSNLAKLKLFLSTMQLANLLRNSLGYVHRSFTMMNFEYTYYQCLCH